MAAIAVLLVGAITDSPAAARTRAEATGKPKAAAAYSGYLKIIVSLRRQRITAYNASGKVVAEAPISSGRPGYSTPAGVFTILDKRRMHYSNLYGAAPMPYMQRLTWSGVALHAGVLPGYPASHGCIRMPHGFAQSLFGITKVGTRVIVSHDDIAPRPIMSARLFTPLPPDDGAPVSTGVVPGTPAVQLVRTAHEGHAVTAAGTSDAANSAATITHTSPSQRTRATVAAERAQMLADLNAAVDAAKTARATAQDRLKEAAGAVDTAKNDLKKAKAQADELERQAKEARKREAAAKAGLEALIKRNPSANLSPERLEELKVSEQTFETTMLAAADDAADFERELSEAAAHLEKLATAIQAAEVARDAAAASLEQAGIAIKDAEVAVESFKRDEKRRALPITVFVSRKAQRIYVRQGFVNILDMPIAIANPDAPLGTHVFTAHEFGPDERSLAWSVATIPTNPPRDNAKGKSQRGTAANEKPAAEAPSLPQTAENALSRIDIPAEAQELIAELVRPGSSLVVSDLGASNETGKYTDFILLTR